MKSLDIEVPVLERAQPRLLLSIEEARLMRSEVPVRKVLLFRRCIVYLKVMK